MRGTDATHSSTDATGQGRKRGPNITPVCLRKDVFEELTLRALARYDKPATDQARADLFHMNRFTVRRLREEGYEPSVGTALHIARVLGVRVEELWGPKCMARTVNEVA